MSWVDEIARLGLRTMTKSLINNSLPASPLTSFSFVTIVAYVMLAAFVFLISRVGGDPGVGWHLKTGEIILATGSVLRSDPFLWNFEGQSWICNQWLADVILYFVYSNFSWLGLHFFCFIIAFSAYFFIFANSVLDAAKPIVAQNIAFALAVLSGSVHWISRPVVFSLLGFAILDAVIRAHRKKQLSNSKFLLALIPLFVAWSNLHPAFVLGLILLSIYAFCAVVENKFCLLSARIPLAAVLLAILATAVNPYGFALHAAALELGRSEFFMNLNIEWLAPTPAGLQFAPLYIAIMVGLFGSYRVNGSLFDTLKGIIFTFLALKGGRFLPFFGIAALPCIAVALQNLLTTTKLESYFSSRPVATRGYLRAIVPGIALMLAVLMFTQPYDEATLGLSPHVPSAAIDAAFSDVGEKLPVFHTPDWGGAIIWKTFPKRLAWIDDRNELNGEQKYRDFLQIENLQEGFEETFNRWNFKRVLIRPGAPFAALLNRDPNWRVIFSDKKALVFERLTDKTIDDVSIEIQ